MHALVAAIGEDGAEILKRLAAPNARLILAREDDGPPYGGVRVFRSGSFSDPAGWARAAFRDWASPGETFKFLGFRVVLPRP